MFKTTKYNNKKIREKTRTQVVLDSAILVANSIGAIDTNQFYHHAKHLKYNIDSPETKLNAVQYKNWLQNLQIGDLVQIMLPEMDWYYLPQRPLLIQKITNIDSDKNFILENYDYYNEYGNDDQMERAIFPIPAALSEFENDALIPYELFYLQCNSLKKFYLFAIEQKIEKGSKYVTETQFFHYQQP